MARSSAVITVLAVAAVNSSVHALPSFLKLIPGSSNVPGVYAIGHVLTGGGGARNSFGEDFDDNGKVWSQALCYKDSDKDGQFNGAELGDPCCEWVQGSNEKLSYTTATGPGDATSKQDPSIWANIKCANGQDPVTKFVAINGNQTSESETAVGDKETVTSKPTITTPAPAPAQKSGAMIAHTATMTAAVVAVLAAVSAWL